MIRSLFRGVSIKWKLTLTILFVATIISISQIVLFTALEIDSYSKYLSARTQTLANVIGLNSTSALQFRDRDDAREVLQTLHLEPSIRQAYLFDNDQGFFADYLREGETLSIPLIQANTEVSKFDKDSFMLWLPIVSEGQNVGLLYLKTDILEIKKRIADSIRLGTYAATGFFLLAFLLALWLQRAFTEPITKVVTTMQKITSDKDYSVRAIQTSEDEFGKLIRGLNFMLDEIEKRDISLAQQMTKLEHINKELDLFVYVASHDLKAPLRAVDNLARLIDKSVKDILPPEKRECIALMHSRIRRMEALFDDLLAYSRVGRVDTDYSEINTYELCVDVVDLLSPPKTFTVVISPHLPRLHGMKTPLQQVFHNLIGNALKHHARKDGLIEVSVRDQGSFFEFCIHDDGPGIPAQYHERIFQMFQTLRPRDEVEGSGMGLALVAKIVESQGGKVRVESAEGTGASFFFTWPKHGKISENS